MSPEAKQSNRCGSCRFFERCDAAKMEEPELFDSGEQTGICRRFPPIYIKPPDSDKIAEFCVTNWHQPRVVDDGWCGEWQPKEGNAS